MNWINRFCVLSVVIVVSSSSMAQSVGDRVRITVSSDDRIDGVLLAKQPNRFDLRLQDGDRVSVSHEEMTLLERHEGKRAFKKLGLFVGAGVGVALGMVLVNWESDQGGIICLTCETEGKIVALAAPGLVFGLVGTGLGAIIKIDRWREMPKPMTGNLRLSPTLNVRYARHSSYNVQLGLSARF